MVSDRSSRADFLTNLSELSMRVLFNSRKCGNMTILSEKTHTNVVFREKTLRSYTPHTKVGKTKCSNIIYSNLINLSISNQIQSGSINNNVNSHRCDKQIKQMQGKQPP